MEKKKQEEITKEAAKTEAKTIAEERAKLAEQPLQGADRTKFQMLVAAERQTDVIKQLYRPEFVGKGFQGFLGKMRDDIGTQEKLAAEGKYIPGAIAGGMREFFGNISPQEVMFRRAVLDVSDMILRARSGAQINEQEYQRLRHMIFKLSDEPTVFLPALQRFRNEIGNQANDVLRIQSTSARGLLEQRTGRKIPKILSITPIRE